MAKKTHKSIEAKKFNYRKNIFFGILILVFILIVVPLALSYSNFYPEFIDRKFIYALDSTVASLPLLPKTPKQVVTKALAETSSISSYQVKIIAKVLAGKTEILNLNSDGTIENAGLLLNRSDLKTQLQSVIIGNAKFETFEDGQTLVFKIDSAPNVDGFNFSNLSKNTWYKVDLTTFQKSLGIISRNDKDIVGDMRGEFEKIRLQLNSSPNFPKVKAFKEVTKDSKNYYQASLNLNNLNVKNSFLGANFDSKITNVDLLINKKTFYIEKINFSTNALALVANSDTFNTTFNYELANINAPQNFPTVETTKLIQNPVDLYISATSTDGASSNAVFEAATKAADFGGNFLTLERILKVIILLPKAL